MDTGWHCGFLLQTKDGNFAVTDTLPTSKGNEFTGTYEPCRFNVESKKIITESGIEMSVVDGIIHVDKPLAQTCHAKSKA